MYEISQLENKRGITIQLDDNTVMQLVGKVGTRIGLLVAGTGGICGSIKKLQRKRGSNCFLTANYVGFGNTEGIGKLKNILNGTYKLPIIEGPYENYSNQAKDTFGFPFYGVIENPIGKELHAFIVLEELNGIFLCFHQNKDSGEYEVIELTQIQKNWQRTRYHEGYGLDTYAEEYKYKRINPNNC